MIEQVFQAIAAVVVSVAFCLLYFAGTNWVLDKFTQRPKGDPTAKRPRADAIEAGVRPWLFLAPALLLLGVFLLYPLLETFRLSFYNATGETFVGWRNYSWVFGDQNFLITIRNNFLWLLVVPAVATVLGLVVAVLADRVWWGNFAKTMVFMPMAIALWVPA